MTYVIARTASGRPSLQHVIADVTAVITACGLDTTWWSRAYQYQPIPQIICKKCGRREVNP